jgi:SAM-dependent methyltransferase
MACDPMPTPAELAAYYANYHDDVLDEVLDQKMVKIHAGIVDLLRRRCKEAAPAVLDYGFGRGWFLRKAAMSGMEAWGVEFTEWKCERIRQWSRDAGVNVSVFSGGLKQLAELPANRFAVATLFQVIEHIPEPLPLLEALHRVLRPDGTVYLECPNNDAFFVRVKTWVRKPFKREGFYRSLNPPQHVYGYNRRSMSQLLRRVGFEPIEVGDYAMADGFHQPETLTFYPPLKEWFTSANRWSAYSFAKMGIYYTERISAPLAGAGGGLYAIARKVR